jgi:hypothetical protein
MLLAYAYDAARRAIERARDPHDGDAYDSIVVKNRELTTFHAG